jgi:hypothetical protein
LPGPFTNIFNAAQNALTHLGGYAKVNRSTVTDPTRQVDAEENNKIRGAIVDMVARDKQRHNSINAVDYGAVADWNGASGASCTGTDNTPFFQAALAAALAAGLDLYIPAGRYLCRAGSVDITYPSIYPVFDVQGDYTITIYGAGMDITELKFENTDYTATLANSWDFFRVNAAARSTTPGAAVPTMNIEGLTSHAPHKTYQGALSANHVRLCQFAPPDAFATYKFRNVKFIGGGFGIRVMADTITTDVRDCYFKTGNDGIHLGINTRGVTDTAYRVGGGGLFVDNCIVDTNYGFDQTEADYLDNLSVHLPNVAGHGILVQYCVKTEIRNTRFLNNGDGRFSITIRNNQDQQSGVLEDHINIEGCRFERDLTAGSVRGAGTIWGGSVSITRVTDCKFFQRGPGFQPGGGSVSILDGCFFSHYTDYDTFTAGSSPGAISTVQSLESPDDGLEARNCVFEYQPGTFGMICKATADGGPWKFYNCSFREPPFLRGYLVFLTLATVGTAGATTYGYTVVPRDAAGNEAGPGGSLSIATGNATLDGTNKISITVLPEPGATDYAIYRTVGGATQGKIGVHPNDGTAFFDTGLVGDGTPAPTTNSTYENLGSCISFGSAEPGTGSSLEFYSCNFDFPNSNIIDTSIACNAKFDRCSFRRKNQFRFRPASGTSNIEFTDCNDYMYAGGTFIDIEPAGGAVVNLAGRNWYGYRVTGNKAQGPLTAGAGTVYGHIKVTEGVNVTTVASAASVELNPNYSTTHITGTTDVANVLMIDPTLGSYEGAFHGPIRLMADNAAGFTLKHGTGNMRLRGGVDKVLIQYDTVTLFWDPVSRKWYEA